MSQKKLVCHGAICSCKYGVSPDKLVVSTQQKTYINDTSGSQKLVATTKELGAPFQAKTFGICKMQPRGSKYKKCKPAITAWNGFYENVQLKANKGFPLLEDSKATCTFGGSPCVKITFHGQVATPSAQNLENADQEVVSQILPIINVNEIDAPDLTAGLEFKTEESELEEKEEEEETNECLDKEIPAAPAKIIGTSYYYKWRFENFMERHNEECTHDPADYYYGPLREIEGGFGVSDAINEWWTPSLEEEMGNEKLIEYKRKYGTFRAVPSEGYGYKYAVRFTKVLMPTLSYEGKQWLQRAKVLLQVYMEAGVVDKNFISARNIDYNERYNVVEDANTFYTDIEIRNNEFRDFAFASHPDAYLDAGLTAIPVTDKMKITATPDWQEWLKGGTWEQAKHVALEQIEDYYKEAEAGVKKAQEEIEKTVRELEGYLELFEETRSTWYRVNRVLDKYRNMPWLN